MLNDGDLPSALAEVVGPANVVTEPRTASPYCVDWTGRFRGSTPAVVLPGSTAEVAAVVDVCRRAGVAVVPQGGNTGLVGGGVPLAGEVVVSLRRLSAMRASAADGQVTAGAGATLAAVQRAAAEAGWAYGVDFAPRDTATVGGTVATNAGGMRVLRYGDTRAQLVGVEAVLGDASVVSHLGGLVKDNTGYHLASLLCGSEGTLGMVTAARLRLVPRTEERAVALLAFDAVEAAVVAASILRRHLGALEALELITGELVGLVCEVDGLPRPFASDHPAYVLLEVADRVSPLQALSDVVQSVPGLAGAAVAVEPAQRAQLWRYRERVTAALNTLGPPHKLDVSLPADRLGEFLVVVARVVAGVAPEGRTWLFGHAGDGNVHVNVTGIAPDDNRADEAVLRMVAAMGGSISAEHGIGTAKRNWLHLARSAEEIRAFRALKAALDPDGILNPNVLLPPAGPAGPALRAPGTDGGGPPP